MNEQNETILSRRGFMGGAAAFAASAMMSRYVMGGSGRSAGKPNSNFNGVQIPGSTRLSLWANRPNNSPEYLPAADANDADR